MTPSQKAKTQRIIYSDIYPTMGMSYDRDVAAVYNNEAIRNSLVGIILTRKGSRPFMPEFGCELGDILFENYSKDVVERAQSDTESAIRAFEPRVDQIQIKAVGKPDLNQLDVTVYYSTVEDPNNVERFNLIAEAASSSRALRLVH